MAGKAGYEGKLSVLAQADEVTSFQSPAMSDRRMPSKKEALRLVRLLRETLVRQHVPVRQVFLFGSVAKGIPHQWSDIDVAVICDPFKASKHEENMEVRKARRGIDIRISPLCFHPEEMDNKYSTIVQEVKRYGIAV
jgi:predicted nucleotidyltransferase